MQAKYVKVLEFYTESSNKEQISLAKKEFQEVLKIISDIKMIEDVKIEKDNEKFGND